MFRLTSGRLYLRRPHIEAVIRTATARTTTTIVAAALGAMGSVAAASAAPAIAPGGKVRAAVPQVSAGPPNGDFSAGLAEWTFLGPVAPQSTGARGVSVARNTTLVSAPVWVPVGAQALRVTVGAPGRGALVQIRARPETGGEDVVLGTLQPPAVPAEMVVEAAPVAGRAVRLVVDPIPAFGASLVVTRVGPFTRPLPGWRVEAGAPEVERRPGGPALVTGDVPLRATSRAFAPGAGAVALIVAVRGAGTVRTDAGGRAVTTRAGRQWRDVAVPLAPGLRRAVLSVAVNPLADGVELRDLGLVRRTVRLVGLRGASTGGRVIVTGSTRPAARRAVFTVRTASGSRVGRGRTDVHGRIRVSVPAGGGALRVVIAGRRDLVGTEGTVRGRR